MTISAKVLGAAGRDNALFVRVDQGQRLTRLLFDCGAGAAAGIGRAEAQQLDLLCFSHLHMDHIAGFDGLFRMLYARTERPNRVYGPPGTIAIMQHRFQGFLWNLEAGTPGAWDVFDIFPDRLAGARFLLGEAFSTAHPLPTVAREGERVLTTRDFTLDAVALEHQTSSLAYLLRELPRSNIDPAKLAALGLVPGPWLQRLKDGGHGLNDDQQRLREQLIVTTPGDSAAYCTDFLLDEAAMARLVPLLRGVGHLFCESQYLAQDAELAQRNFHMTAPQAAALASQAGAGRLTLLHVSERYRALELHALLAEAQAIFPAAQFPAHWQLGSAAPGSCQRR
ncbi:MAG: ribonuclease Z [Roseiflexaceae bacterium]|nr:ribonuclease Z [Roseiflexaceae bacterium]